MPLRVLTSMNGAWRDWDAAYPVSKYPKSKLPLVIAVVLAHCEGGWTTPRSMHDLFGPSPSAIAGLERHIPGFEAIVIELTATQRNQLVAWANDLVAKRAPAQAVMLHLLVVVRVRRSDLSAAIAQMLDDVAAVLEAMANDPGEEHNLRTLFDYLSLQLDDETWREFRVMLDAKAPQAARVMSTLEEMVKQVAIEKGKARGLAEGKARGLAEGEAKGRAEEARDLVGRWLSKLGTLSDAQRAVLDAATLEQLETFADRLPGADSIEAVLGV